MGLHEGLTFSLFLFALVIDESKWYEGEVPWCMLYVDDIILIDETRVGVNAEL